MLYSLKSSTIEEIYEKNIESILHEALEEMNPNIRETYLLRLRKGMTNLEISKDTDTPLRTVEYRIKKALLILHKKLKDYINAVILFFAALSLW